MGMADMQFIVRCWCSN